MAALTADPTVIALDAMTLVFRRDDLTNSSKDSNIGSATSASANANSASSILSTLAPTAGYAAALVVLFLILRPRIPRRYSPRALSTYFPAEAERSPPLPNGVYNWFVQFWNIPDTQVLRRGSLDSYFFLRFLRLVILLCVVGCCISWPILWPIFATGGSGKKQLDLLTMGNISTNPSRYLAPCFIGVIFMSFVMFMLTMEMKVLIKVRQTFLLSRPFARQIHTRTVLYTSVPSEYLNEENLREILGDKVKRVWIPTDTKELEDMVEDRDKAAFKLEASEVKFIKAVNQARTKELAKQAKLAKKGKGRTSGSEAEESPDGIQLRGSDGELDQPESEAARWMDPKLRPTHRLKPLIGKKVDTIDYCRGELKRLLPQIEEEQAKHRGRKAKLVHACFVEFETVADAQSAYQDLTHHEPLRMAPRYTGMKPDEVIWSNLRVRWWERAVRLYAGHGLITALVIFWSIPVAFVSSISNVNYLTTELHWLAWINDIPSSILGVVTGLLPSVLLSLLIALVPPFMRFVAKQGGSPTVADVEARVQDYFFSFQVVQVFLVATLGSAASASAAVIVKDPTSVTSLLANQLPLASNFYLSFFVVQGLGVVASQLVGLPGLVMTYIFGKLLDKTPRKMYKRATKVATVSWGTVMPVFTNYLVIAICYATIAPLVLIFAAIGIYFFYTVYRYNILYVIGHGTDTLGQLYARALQHIFVGIYLSELCLIGLFAIKSGSSKCALASLIIMVIFLVLSALYHLSLNSAMGPLLRALPKTLVAEEHRLRALEESPSDNDKAATNGHTSAEEAGRMDSYPHSEPVSATNTAATGRESDAEKGMIFDRSPPAPRRVGTVLDPSSIPAQSPRAHTEFFRPDRYLNHAVLRKMVPHDMVVTDPGEQPEHEVARQAYYLPPCIGSRAPLLWVPRDALGVTAAELARTGEVIGITDELAWVDERGKKITWCSEEPERAPIVGDDR